MFWEVWLDDKLARDNDTDRADRDELIGMIHHGNEEIEKNYDVDDGETAKHDKTPKPVIKLLFISHL